MRRPKILIYLIIAFLWSWANWLTGLRYFSHGFTDESIGRFISPFYIGVYGPAISAIITTLCFNGFKGVLELLKKLFIWRVPFRIYLFVVLAPILFVVSGMVLYWLFGGKTGPIDWKAIYTIPGILWASLFAGPLGEELGWRGVLLPELQKKYSALKSSLIIGPIWYCWHLPLFWAPFGTLVSGASHSFLPLFTYLVFVTCMSCYSTWLVNNSRGSVLIAILNHLSVNAGIALLFFPGLQNNSKQVYLLSTPVLFIFTVFLGVRTGFAQKGRGKKIFY